MSEVEVQYCELINSLNKAGIAKRNWAQMDLKSRNEFVRIGTLVESALSSQTTKHVDIEGSIGTINIFLEIFGEFWYRNPIAWMYWYLYMLAAANSEQGIFGDIQSLDRDEAINMFLRIQAKAPKGFTLPIKVA